MEAVSFLQVLLITRRPAPQMGLQNGKNKGSVSALEKRRGRTWNKSTKVEATKKRTDLPDHILLLVDTPPGT